MQDRPKGLLIILFGVLIISPDAVLVRYLSEGGAEPWTIIFWKMLFAIPITAVFAVWEAGSFQKLWSSMVYSKKYYAIAIPLQCVVVRSSNCSSSYNDYWQLFITTNFL